MNTWTQKENQLDFFAGFSAVTQTLFSRRGNLVTLVQFMDLVNIQYCHQKLVTMLQYRKDVTELHYCQQVVTRKLWLKIAATDLRFLRIETTRGALLSNACSSSKGAESVGFDDGVAWKVQVGCLRACCFHRWWLNCNILVFSKQFLMSTQWFVLLLILIPLLWNIVKRNVPLNGKMSDVYLCEYHKQWTCQHVFEE